MPISNPVSGQGVGCKVYHSVNQSLANNTNNALSFNSERFDTDNIHNTVSNTARLTCNTAGNYLIGGSVAFAASAMGGRQINIFLNGVTTIALENTTNMGAGTPTLMSISTVHYLSAGDYVQLFAYQGSGSALNVLASSAYSPEFYMHRLP